MSIGLGINTDIVMNIEKYPELTSCRAELASDFYDDEEGATDLFFEFFTVEESTRRMEMFVLAYHNSQDDFDHEDWKSTIFFSQKLMEIIRVFQTDPIKRFVPITEFFSKLNFLDSKEILFTLLDEWGCSPQEWNPSEREQSFLFYKLLKGFLEAIYIMNCKLTANGFQHIGKVKEEVQ